MKISKLKIIEIFLGIALIVLGIYVFWLEGNLVRIMIYPLPKEIQIKISVLRVLPYFLWLIGFLLVVDGIRRALKQK